MPVPIVVKWCLIMTLVLFKNSYHSMTPWITPENKSAARSACTGILVTTERFDQLGNGWQLMDTWVTQSQIRILHFSLPRRYALWDTEVKTTTNFLARSLITFTFCLFLVFYQLKVFREKWNIMAPMWRMMIFIRVTIIITQHLISRWVESF